MARKTQARGRHMAAGQRPHARWPYALAALLVCAVIGLTVWVLRPTPIGDAKTEAGTVPVETKPEEGAMSEGATTEGTTAEEAPKTELAKRFGAGEVASVRLVGDSITAGYGTDGYTDPNLAGEGAVIYDDGAGTRYYETPEEADCWANAFRSYAREHGVSSFVNAGINGAFMAELAQNPDAWLADGADLVVVALGTNDAGYYGPEEYRSYATTALEAAANKSSLLVVVSPVSDLRPEWQLVEPAASLGDVLREICDEHGYLFVDARDAVAPEQFCDDGLHPSTDGSLAIWRCVKETLGL